jgi:translocation and assembly module TamB
MKVMQALRIVLLRFFAAAFIVLGSAYFIFGTETGFQLVWSGVARFMPETVKIGNIKGTLLSHIVINDLTYTSDSLHLSIHYMDLDWKALRLLDRRLVIKDLKVDGVTVAVAASKAQPATDKSDFDLDALYLWLTNVDIGHAAFHNVHVQVAGASFMLEGSLDEDWHLQWAIDAPDLSQVVGGINGKLTMKGSVVGGRYQPEIQTALTLSKFASGFVKIESLMGTLNSQYKGVMTDQTKLQVKGLDIHTFLVPDFSLQTTGKFQAGAFQQAVKIVLSPVNTITGSFSLPKLNKKAALDQVFHAKAMVDVKDFSQFKTLFIDVPQVRSLNGRVTGTFTGRGTLAHPIFDGGLQAHQGSVYIPAASMQLSNINLVTRYHTGQYVNLNGDFTVLAGKINVAGTYGIEDSALPLRLKITGTDLLVKDSKEYKIKITPDILLDYRNNDLTLTGKVLVPHADIKPIDISGTSSLPSDVVIVNNQTKDVSVPTNLSLRLQVILGEHIKVKYRGLKASLKGGITILSENGNPLTATGEFGIAKDGTYHAYGRSLRIQQGRIIYAGNLLTNPGISLRATQTIKRVSFSGGTQFEGAKSGLQQVYSGNDVLTVGVEVSGMIEKPRVVLFSDPAGLSQADILSYLLLGYPQSQASGASSLALLNVVTDMYGQGDQNKKSVVNNLQQSLGLDELSVGSTEYYDASGADVGSGAGAAAHNTTTVNVGRSLGHNLSLHYSVGIFQQIQIFSLRYQINQHLAVQTETSTLENGGDLLYQLESRD